MRDETTSTGFSTWGLPEKRRSNPSRSSAAPAGDAATRRRRRKTARRLGAEPFTAANIQKDGWTCQLGSGCLRIQRYLAREGKRCIFPAAGVDIEPKPCNLYRLCVDCGEAMISNRCYYALKAMLELARREGSGPAPIGEIAREQDVPTRFLEAILRQLKQAGLTDSARGKDGGYFLSKPARAIKVGDVIRLFEGPLVGVSPAAGSNSGGKAQGRGDVFREIWEHAEVALSSVYDAVNFGELAEKERMRKTGGVANYSI